MNDVAFRWLGHKGKDGRTRQRKGKTSERTPNIMPPAEPFVT